MPEHHLFAGFRSHSQTVTALAHVAAPEYAPLPASPGEVHFVKGGAHTAVTDRQVVRFAKGSGPKGSQYTIFCHFGDKDYDALAYAVYRDGHVEVVSTFGTKHHERDFQTKTHDGAVVHVSGDHAAYGGGGSDGVEDGTEVIFIDLNPEIVAVVPYIYSAQNSGVGSFNDYQVGTYIFEGHARTLPGASAEVTMVSVTAREANSDVTVYSFVPCVIHNDPEGPRLEAVMLYSRPGSENRPEVDARGVVTMDAGPVNAYKKAPGQD